MNPNLKAFSRRTEILVVNGQKFVIKELHTAAEVQNPKDDPDHSLKLAVMCTFEEDGVTPAFTEADIPDMKEQGSMSTMVELYQAISRVNGMDVKEQAKNSGAVPSGE